MVEQCVVTWWKFPDITWRCTEKISTPSVTVQSEVSFSIEVLVGILFVICAGMLGVIIIELLYNKSDYFLTPLIDKMRKRYNWTLERNRLRTMQGHP